MTPLHLPRKPRKDDELEVEITDFTGRGQGLGELVTELGPQNEPRVFQVEVRRTVPGDRVRARVDHVRKNKIEAGAVDMLALSEMRIAPRCQHFGRREVDGEGCGGCALQHIDYQQQLELKHELVVRALAHHGVETSVEPPIGQAEPWFYRNKMELSFSREEDGGGAVTLGLFPLGWRRQVVDLRACYLQSEAVAPLVDATRQWARELGLRQFVPNRGAGFLRTLTIREGKRTGERMIVLTTSHLEPEGVAMSASAAAESFGEMIDAFAREHDIQLDTGVWVQHRAVRGQPTRYDVHTLFGSGLLHEVLHLPAGRQLAFEIHPLAFFQPNSRQAEVLYGLVIDAVRRAATDSARVLDLYCGTGTIGLCIAPWVGRVIGVELQPDAVENARRNAAYNQLDNVEFHAGDVSKLLEGTLTETLTGGGVDAVVVDPPRSGLRGNAIDHLRAIDSPRLVYVSCSPTSLARDLFRLRKDYEICSVQPVDMFSQTPHVETVVELVRR